MWRLGSGRAAFTEYCVDYEFIYEGWHHRPGSQQWALKLRRSAEGRHQGEARSHGPARGVQEGTRPPGRRRPRRRQHRHGRAKGEAELQGRHLRNGCATFTLNPVQTNLTLQQPVELWVDTDVNALTKEHRYYRILPGP